MMTIPTIETERLLIRPFKLDDLTAHQVILASINWIDLSSTENLAKHRAWLEWTVRNYDALKNLCQPPYGDRAVTLKTTGLLLGAVGLVPAFGPFGQLAYYRAQGIAHSNYMPEIGLFWAIGKDHQRFGYATEAVSAIARYAFDQLNIHRLVATTDYDNHASIALMRRLGMIIEHNLMPTPTWFQTIGILERSTYNTKSMETYRD